MTVSTAEPMTDAAPILEVSDVTVTFGGLVAVRRATFGIEAGTVTALIGPNGAGKSTLLNVISGFIRPDKGQVVYRGHDITTIRPHTAPSLGLARTFQHVDVTQELTVCENVVTALQDQIGERPLRVLVSPLKWKRERQNNVRRALEILDRVGLTGRADVLASDLAYGEQKQLVLARLIATDADLLMLDEPGAGMPASSLDEIGRILQELVRDHGKSVVLVDHNMQLVLNYAEQVIVLHHGEVIATGPPDEIRRNADVLRVYLSRDETMTGSDDPSDGAAEGAGHA